jgi:hypothetical protein
MNPINSIVSIGNVAFPGVRSFSYLNTAKAEIQAEILIQLVELLWLDE